ncbi:hypothetical protein PHYSODRAFT_502857 [Phytophthora sojae]|uniref:Uncharacterized protein n=1 Tax=Phytophthora sojae (strain P6497) TaxID=1094619 RepID=G4ZGE1_PHYSP|nr:hypothetical protein PHYSODRAFT_502857 [Phytophthora sojae]EGZ18586.1 hypothetical protein PHYSODRAFT_502857 [Phytophthora sojae]|eukprot:XP_009527644.1 hypothetical protein PHYSODRAFT_502857 [Phytophthora sojae]
MAASAARAAIRDAIATKSFPPAIAYPEKQRNAMLSAWFNLPTITWVPDVLNAGRSPVCTTEGCKCTPKVKEYLQRTVHDVEHKTILYYARYKCSTGRSFSTIDDAYLSSSKAVFLAFLYLLTYQTAISLDLFELVYDSMLTTKGLAGATDNVTRRRQKRYYALLARAGCEIEKRKAADTAYAPPLLQSVEQYMTNHICLDSEALQKVWLSQTEVCSRLLEAQMAVSQCEKVIRVDHSQKFCSKLKVFGSDGSKEQASSVRMLLLVQNEIGQVVARGLTRSENHEETEAILHLIKKLFGDSVAVKQDPFHVIQRLAETISDQAQRGWLAKRLSAAIYDVERKILSPSATAENFAEAASSVPTSSIRVSTSEWEGCVNSNLEQIRQGDLFVEGSDYSEGGSTVRVVSTSQLEAIHSKLRKLLDRVLSIEVGLRILDIFLLQVSFLAGDFFYWTVC